MKRPIASLLMILAIGLLGWSGLGCQASASAEPEHKVSKGKQTVLGLYVTAAEAYEKWKADPDGVKILDVRTPEEFMFVGHPAMAWNIPFMLQTYEWDAAKGKLPMVPNPEFLDRVRGTFKPTDTILIMCRSGGRSAHAVDVVAEAGFKKAYSVIDGMEGDVVDDPESVFQGKRMMNGWKNSGLPWTYSLDAERMALPKTGVALPKTSTPPPADKGK